MPGTLKQQPEFGADTGTPIPKFWNLTRPGHCKWGTGREDYQLRCAIRASLRKILVVFYRPKTERSSAGTLPAVPGGSPSGPDVQQLSA